MNPLTIGHVWQTFLKGLGTLFEHPETWGVAVPYLSAFCIKALPVCTFLWGWDAHRQAFFQSACHELGSTIENAGLTVAGVLATKASLLGAFGKAPPPPVPALGGGQQILPRNALPGV